VARMVNMDYIPEGFTLDNMLSAFQEEAEVEFENAKIDRLPNEQVELLKVRLKACEARRSLAQLLLEAFHDETHSTQESMIVCSPDSSSKPRYTLESVADWASYKYGIGIPEWWSTDSDDPVTSKGVPDGVKWEDIEIRIWKDNRIAFSHEKGEWNEKTFIDIGLLGLRKQNPNKLAGILIGLSVNKKYPPSRTAAPNHKTAISRLRNSLKNLTGINSDPFLRLNETDGWKPRFKLTDARRDADDRAEKAAVLTEYDDRINHDNEKDEAGIWLEEDK
jgi:hypothetical protein